MIDRALSTGICIAIMLFTVALPLNAANYRALSLRVLQDQLPGAQAEVRQHLLQLGGISRIDGFVIDEEGSDLILFGETNGRALSLEDLAIALKNAWGKFNEVRGNTSYYSYPGCTIDPNPFTWRRLEQIDPTQRQDWELICGEPQTVGVFGVPFNSMFARTMVRADYQMKRLVDGSENPGISGFRSLTDSHADRIRAAEAMGEDIGSMTGPGNRFWFSPGKNRYDDSSGVVFLSSCPIILLTEISFLGGNKGFVRGDRADPLAQQCADDFTRLFSEFAARYESYADLESLFRNVAIAKIIKSQTDAGTLTFDLSPLLNLQVEPTEVPRQVPGLSRILELEQPGVKRVLRSCGGVTVQIQPRQENFNGRHISLLRRIKDRILGQRKSKEDLHWDMEESTSSPILLMRHVLRTAAMNDRSGPLIVRLQDTTVGFEAYDGTSGKLYSGNDIPKFLEYIVSWAKSINADAVYLDLEGIAVQKRAGFTTSVEMQLPVRTFSDPSLANMIMLSGTRLDSISPISEGRLQFAIQTSYQGREETLKVEASSWKTGFLKEFKERLAEVFHLRRDNSRSFIDIINGVRGEMMDKHHLNERELDKVIKVQIGKSQFIKLSRPRDRFSDQHANSPGYETRQAA